MNKGLHVCVLFETQKSKCFGNNIHGQLGLEDSDDRSGTDMGNNLPFVDVGKESLVNHVAVGLSHTCVIVDSIKLKCFGLNDSGQLGHGDTTKRGHLTNSMGDFLL